MMEFFAIKTRHEGDPMGTAMISGGRCLEVHRTDCTRLIQNGFYVRVTIPFTVDKKYVDHRDYLEKVGPCHFTFALRVRRPRQLGYYRWLWTSFWAPTENKPAGIEPDIAWPRK